MKPVPFKKTLTSIIAFSGICLLPFTSYATDYSNRYYSNDCYQNSNDQRAAGLFGAVIGGVVGSRIAGRGDRTEGAVIGAILGGTTAAAISDGRRSNRYDPNCERIRRQISSRNYRNNQYSNNNNLNNLNNFSNQLDYYSIRSRRNIVGERGIYDYQSYNNHRYEHQHDHAHNHGHYHDHDHDHDHSYYDD